MTREDIINLRKQGKTLQEIASMHGCSRQYIHQIIKNPPKRKNQKKAPTKAELYAQVEALTKENIPKKSCTRIPTGVWQGTVIYPY